MAYKRKTIDTFEIQGFTSEGWELETTEETYKNAKAQIKIYRAEQPQIQHRIKLKRERIYEDELEAQLTENYIGMPNRSALPTITIESVTYYVDFRLEEIRPINAPYLAVYFTDLSVKVKAQLRGIRTAQTSYGHIPSLDN